MPEQLEEKSIKRVNRFFKAMLPKRCNKRNKGDEPKLNTDRDEEGGKENLSDPTMSCSPKKRRGDKASSTIHFEENIPTFPPHYQYALESPVEYDQILTPPVVKSSIGSPPHLQQINHMVGTNKESVLPLPLLPSDLLNDDSANFAPKFKLNPRLQWNPEMISKQLKCKEQSLASLLHDEETIISSSPPRSIVSKILHDFSENVNIECVADVVYKPVPRYGSTTVATATATGDYDHTTLINTVAEESCCAWFSPSWKSAFDAIEPRHEDTKK